MRLYPQRLDAHALRILSVDAVERAASGHPGLPLGMADVVCVLFTQFLKYDAQHPEWPDRDRFVLSAGHGCALLYSALYLLGVPGMTLEALKQFRRLDSVAAGHPEYGHTPGIEATTGPLSQGLANAVGMALSEKKLVLEFPGLIDHRTYVLVSDGCLMEGLSQEAISLASHWNLNKLVALYDDNRITIDGDTSLSRNEDMALRFEAAGWDVHKIDGHCLNSITEALTAVQKAERPSVIFCRTLIGYGSSKAGSEKVHGSPLGAKEVEALRATLEWPSLEPFDVPKEILDFWRQAGQRHAPTSNTWSQKLSEHPLGKQLEKRLIREIPEAAHQALETLKEKAPVNATTATRQSSGAVLKALAPCLPALLGGSADLTESTQTDLGDPQRFLHYGVREHAMAAVMNGIALHGGYLPYGGTFLVFSDYARPAIRLSALMGLQVLYIMTHDSIGLGEDGPTHQPIEHLASFRAMPNLLLLRPCDDIEVAECYQLALENTRGPSMLCLTRQALPRLRTCIKENLCARGAYILRDVPSSLALEIDLWASGSEVTLACEVQSLLETKGIGARVISAPSWMLFDQQESTYRDSLTQAPSRKVVIEAAHPLGWERYVGQNALIFGLKTFGASGPCKDLYKHFGLVASVLAEKILLK